jgi:hypothetical protein
MPGRTRARLNNPVWHIHGGDVPESTDGGAVRDAAEPASVGRRARPTRSTLWGFIRRYAPDASPESHPDLDRRRLCGALLRGFREARKDLRAPTDEEREALEALRASWRPMMGRSRTRRCNRWSMPWGATGSTRCGTGSPRFTRCCWARARGRAFGGFIALYGVDETVALIDRALAGELAYLQVRARVKAVAGALPRVRIAGYAGGAGGNAVPGVVTAGPEVTLTQYGRVVEVSAIVGIGDRGGVDMSWSAAALFGHFGLDLVGPSGGVVRIDDISITDITSVFLRDMISVVDVRDYGAIGDGATDDSAAFEAAAAAANGRTVLVPAGTFFLAGSVSLNAPVKFEGQVTMPADAQLLLPKAFDLPTYIAAFGDEELGFKKAFQALLNNVDHDSLDMGGRKVSVSAPVDMQAAVVNKSSFETRRVIRNGQIEAADSSAWTSDVVTSQAGYDPQDPRRLSNVAAIETIAVGALVEGNGVGREIYVRGKNEATQEITLSAPLYGAQGNQTYTFTKFKHMLDFSGFGRLANLELQQVELQCNGRASAILLAQGGESFGMSNCVISRPRDRGVTSIGGGCLGMLADRCTFRSDEADLPVADRRTVALNINSDHIKLRDCKASGFLHFAILGGQNNIVLGNHVTQGDDVNNGLRSAGIVLTDQRSFASITGNQIEDCFVEWSNERDADVVNGPGKAFRSLTMTDNLFLSGSVADWFSFFVVKPIGPGHFLHGLTVTGNKFRSTQGAIDRVERIDTSLGDINYDRFSLIDFNANSFRGVSHEIANPLRVQHDENSTSPVWVVSGNGHLPFDAEVLNVDAIVARGPVIDEGGATVHAMPYAVPGQGATRKEVHLYWGQPVQGTAIVTMRIDD